MVAPILATGAVENCTNPGTGGFTLLGPASGVRRRFRDDPRVTSGRQIFYAATDGTQSEWGVGTLTIGQNGANDTFSRDTVIVNTAGNANALNFTGNLVVYSSDQSVTHPMKDLSGKSWSGVNSDDLMKTEGNTLPGSATVADVNGFGSSATAVTSVGVTVVAKRLMVWAKGILSFASGYSPPSGEFAQATFTLAVTNGATTIVQTSDIAICNASMFGKIATNVLASGLSEGTTYSITGSIQVTNSPDNSASCRLSGINLSWLAI